MLKPYLERILSKSYLTREEAQEAMEAMIEGADPHQIASFLILLSYRTEAPEELAGMVKALEKELSP